MIIEYKEIQKCVFIIRTKFSNKPYITQFNGFHILYMHTTAVSFITKVACAYTCLNLNNLIIILYMLLRLECT